MAGSPWTCERCDNVNDAGAPVCAVCGEPAPAARRSRSLWVLLGLVVVAAASIGATILIAANRPEPAKPLAQFPTYTPAAAPSSTKLTTSTTTATAAPLTPTTSTSAAEKPCPAATAQYLPGGEGIALLVAQTAKSFITICQTGDGQMFYDGQTRNTAPSAETHITLPAQPSGDGFVAANGEYRYTIGGGKLVVSVKDQVLTEDALTPVS
jgi:hypothetical protein